MIKDCDDCIHRIDSEGRICKGDGHYSKGYCDKFEWKDKRLERCEVQTEQVIQYITSELRGIRHYKRRADRLLTLMRHRRRYSAWYEHLDNGKVFKRELDNQERLEFAEEKYLSAESELRGFLNAYNMITGEELYYYERECKVSDKYGKFTITAHSEAKA